MPTTVPSFPTQSTKGGGQRIYLLFFTPTTLGSDTFFLPSWPVFTETCVIGGL